jgi:FG-GAP-like repeat
MARSSTGRKILLTVSVVLLGAAGWGWARVRSIENNSLRLATTGRAAIALLGELAAAIKSGDPAAIAACYAPNHDPITGGWVQEPAESRDGVSVYTWKAAPDAAAAEPDAVYRDLLAELGPASWTKGKLRLVESDDGTSAVIRSFLWLRGKTADDELYEAQARLRMWIVSDDSGAWKIQRQELLDGKTVVGPGAGFGDATADSGIDFRSSINPRFSDPDWQLQKFGITKYASAGASAADYDGDGWYDLFLGDGRAAHLYHNEGLREAGGLTVGGVHFRDVTAEVGLPTELPGVNVGLFADLDNDGDEDLFLGRFMDGNKLYRNDGGTFTEVPVPGEAMERGFVTVASAADYDGDGLLDIYMGRYLDPRTHLPDTLFYTRNGEGNTLLHNDGDLAFTDVTAAAGVREGGLTLGTSWADYDRDGDLDIHVANDFGRNALLRNEGDGTFSDVTDEAGVLDFGFGMSSSWGDVDNDGDLDLYVSNVHSGQRWYGQATTLFQYLLNSLRQGTIRQDFPLYREIYAYTGPDWSLYGDGMVKGNSLLLNDGHGRFTEVSETAGSNPYGWYWGSTFLDYDNDGRLDIYAANGWISGKTFDDL